MITNSKNKIAVIDIGSNSLRLMTAERTANGKTTFSPKTVRTTRLAEDFLPDKTLKQPALERSFSVLSEFSQTAGALGLPVFAYATNAVRDALNRTVFIERAEKDFGIPVSVLSGEEEASLARLGAGLSHEDGMIDIGGGSFQISAGSFRKSFPLGCVKIRGLCGEEEESLALLSRLLPETVDALIGDTSLPQAGYWTAVGGTATHVACMLSALDAAYSSNTVKNAVCTPEALDGLLRDIEAIPLESRRSLPLLSKRADLILGGGALLLLLMEKLGISTLRFSDADGLEGYALYLLDHPERMAELFVSKKAYPV